MFSVCDSEVKQMKTAEHIIETVDKLVRKYHTRDPYELCQLLGIKIHYYDLQKKLKGFFYYQSRQKNIVIDHNVNGILERILVAHELGHAVLHTKIAMMHGFQEMEVFDDRSIEENEANFFAAELLLEDGKVLRKRTWPLNWRLSYPHSEEKLVHHKKKLLRLLVFHDKLIVPTKIGHAQFHIN